MPNSIVNTARGTANIEQKRVVVDMSNSISLLKPRLYPLTVLSKKLGTQGANNYKFEWMEDSLLSRWVTCPAGVTDTATEITLGASEGGLVSANDLLKVVETGEVLRATLIANDKITVTRAYGTTSAKAIPAGAKILVMGNAMMQGSGAPAEKYHQPVPVFNYTQIFKTAFSVTNTLEAIKLYGRSELARLQMHKGIEHAQSIEYAAIFGERSLVTSGAQPISTTGGVMQFLAGTENVDAISGTTGKLADLFDYCEKIFTYGSDTKTWLCSPAWLTFMAKIAADYLHVIQADNDKTLGLNITQFRSPHGVLNMVPHPLFVQGYADLSIILDMEELKYRPLSGRDTKLQTNIQAPDEDGRRDQLITEAGFEIRQPKKHGILTLGN